MKKLSLIVGIILIGIASTKAQMDPSRGKAMLTYNFTKFFEWPMTERAGDFVIGVLGSSSIYNNLVKSTKGKTVTAQNITVKKFRNFSEVTKCHVIFVSFSNVSDIEKIHSKAGHYCLVVSDSDSAIEKGAVISFQVVNEKLVYEFKGANAKKQGLNYHSKIEQMASKVY